MIINANQNITNQIFIMNFSHYDLKIVNFYRNISISVYISF